MMDMRTKHIVLASTSFLAGLAFMPARTWIMGKLETRKVEKALDVTPPAPLAAADAPPTVADLGLGALGVIRDVAEASGANTGGLDDYIKTVKN